MDIFDLDQALIERYESFARSFSEIRASEIRAQVDTAYNEQRFWPEPLITINPRFESGHSVDQLVAQEVLDPALSRILPLNARLVANSGFHTERLGRFARKPVNERGAAPESKVLRLPEQLHGRHAHQRGNAFAKCDGHYTQADAHRQCLRYTERCGPRRRDERGAGGKQMANGWAKGPGRAKSNLVVSWRESLVRVEGRHMLLRCSPAAVTLVSVGLGSSSQAQ